MECELHVDGHGSTTACGPDMTPSTKQLGPNRKGDQEGMRMLTTELSGLVLDVAVAGNEDVLDSLLQLERAATRSGMSSFPRLVHMICTRNLGRKRQHNKGDYKRRSALGEPHQKQTNDNLRSLSSRSVCTCSAVTRQPTTSVFTDS